MISLFILLVIIVFALFPSVIAPYGYDDQDMSRTFQAPCWKYLLEKSSYGRDVFSRVVYGSRISLQRDSIVVTLSLVLGGTVGIIAAYYKKFDNFIMRVMDLFMAVPGTLLAIVIAATLGPGMTNLMIAVAIASVPQYARVTRSACLTSMHCEYIEAANSLGASDLRMQFQAYPAQFISPIIVQCTLSIGMPLLPHPV